MIITCSCSKKFNVDASLIPREGRLLKCSSCGRKWHYKHDKTTFNDDLKKKDIKIKKVNPDEKIPFEVDKIITQAEHNKAQKVLSIHKPQVNIPFFNILILLLITFVAFIILLDTFKNPINELIPGFIFLLDNFYESLRDTYLFIKDLLR